MKKILIISVLGISLLAGCRKSEALPYHSPLDDHSSQLLIDWINVQFRLIRNSSGIQHVAYSRHFSYTGLALYESLVPGDKRYKSVKTLLSGAINLPETPRSGRIYYPAAANAALAGMFRYFYPSPVNHAPLIDSLEWAYINKDIALSNGKYDLPASIDYGKKIAEAVIAWSQGDGASAAAIAYTPRGEGFWEPTPPAFAAAAVPGWGNNRTIIKGSTESTDPGAPLGFMKEEGSLFYNMVKELYDISQTLTTEQKNIADFWDDAPNGRYLSAFGHWFSILKQVLENEKTPLMKGAEAWLRLGLTMNDVSISCWKSKYSYHMMRPVTYIRKYLGKPQWSPYISTPPHPEYVAAHASISAAAAYALETVFGKNHAFTDHTYDALGMTPRSYTGFEAAGEEAGLSRLYGGIHYRPSIIAGRNQGRKVGRNIELQLQSVRIEKQR